MNAVALNDAPDSAPLKGEFDPAVADCGYRAPLTPRLARSRPFYPPLAGSLRVRLRVRAAAGSVRATRHPASRSAPRTPSPVPDPDAGSRSDCQGLRPAAARADSDG